MPCCDDCFGRLWRERRRPLARPESSCRRKWDPHVEFRSQQNRQFSVAVFFSSFMVGFGPTTAVASSISCVVLLLWPASQISHLYSLGGEEPSTTITTSSTTSLVGCPPCEAARIEVSLGRWDSHRVLFVTGALIFLVGLFLGCLIGRCSRRVPSGKAEPAIRSPVRELPGRARKKVGSL